MHAPIESTGPEDTRKAGQELGTSLKGGELVFLRGPLGAGKTLFARGIADALNITRWRGSPTFTLINEYASTPALIHLDLYRLEGRDVEDLGVEDYLGPHSVCVVEWPERAAEFLWELPASRVLDVDITIIGRDTRSIAVTYRNGVCSRAAGEG